MIKINSTQVVSKELRKVRHFSSIITKKLKSESISSENINSFTFEELTDIIEVINRISELKGVSHNELEKIRQKKADERGKFNENLFLVDVIKEE